MAGSRRTASFWLPPEQLFPHRIEWEHPPERSAHSVLVRLVVSGGAGWSHSHSSWICVGSVVNQDLGWAWHTLYMDDVPRDETWTPSGPSSTRGWACLQPPASLGSAYPSVCSQGKQFLSTTVGRAWKGPQIQAVQLHFSLPPGLGPASRCSGRRSVLR